MELDDKVKFLEDLGFEIDSGTRSVYHSGHSFDFSATRMEPEAILSTVIQKMFSAGEKVGRKRMRGEFRSLLGLENDYDDSDDSEDRRFF